jgi:hypothetical protein
MSRQTEAMQAIQERARSQDGAWRGDGHSTMGDGVWTAPHAESGTLVVAAVASATQAAFAFSQHAQFTAASVCVPFSNIGPQAVGLWTRFAPGLGRDARRVGSGREAGTLLRAGEERRRDGGTESAAGARRGAIRRRAAQVRANGHCVGRI